MNKTISVYTNWKLFFRWNTSTSYSVKIKYDR